MIKRYNIKDGINLYHIDSKKFKTVSVGVNIHRPLCREEVSLNALLPEVMHRGNATYKETSSLAKYLQTLYGAGFDSYIKRKGEDQIIAFSVSVVADKFLDGDKCTKKAISLLYDMLLNPLIENGGFKSEYVEQEKINLINDIEALINDKRSYSVWRIVELMCDGDGYGIHELGKKEDVEKITPIELYKHYEKIIRTSPIDIFITGDVDIEEAIEDTKKCFEKIVPVDFSYPICDKFSGFDEVKEITEKFDVTQAKLCVGFKTDIMPQDDDYSALMVFNGIFGGGAHSKLFNNVREKLSLCYYASSRLERYKGIMLVASGIEIANKQKALDEIFVQFEAMKKGDISDYEFSSTIKSITNSLASFSDDVGYLRDYYLGQIVTGTMESIEEYTKKILAVTLEDVVRVAQKIEPQMVYFLTGNGEVEINEA